MDLRFKPLSKSDDLPTMDFNAESGTDILGVGDFFCNHASTYKNNNLTTVWVVTDEEKPLACFTMSMNAIEVEELDTSERIPSATTKRYPAALLGQMWVNPPQRGQGIGLEICNFCAGLAMEISARISCRYVVLQTDNRLSRLIELYEKAEFVKSLNPPKKNIIWMYRRIA